MPKPTAKPKKSPAQKGKSRPVASPSRRSWLLPLLSLALVGAACFFAFDLRAVDATSMEPSLLPGEWVLVDKLSSEMGWVGLGDVVIVRNPAAREEQLLLRVAALEGDVVSLTGAELAVNDKPLLRELDGDGHGVAALDNGVHHPVRAEPAALQSAKASELEVPKGHLYLLADERSRAFDSRSFGPLPIAEVQGVVRLIVRSDDSNRGLFGRWLRGVN